MCLAVPAMIVSILDNHAWVENMGMRQKVNIQLISSPMPGEYVLVHAGFAIEKIDSEYYKFLNDTLYEMLNESPSE